MYDLESDMCTVIYQISLFLSLSLSLSLLSYL